MSKVEIPFGKVPTGDISSLLLDTLGQAAQHGLKVALIEHNHNCGSDTFIVLHNDDEDQLPKGLVAYDPEHFSLSDDDNGEFASVLPVTANHVLDLTGSTQDRPREDWPLDLGSILASVTMPDSDRVFLKVAGFEVVLVKTDEGLVVDIFAPGGNESLASTYAFDQELVSEE